MKKPTQVVNFVCLFVAGAAVGWLIGLSASPVVNIVITSLVAITVSATSALAGLSVTPGNDAEPTRKPRRRPDITVNPVPVMVGIVGIAVGASIGVYGRTNGWLNPNATRFSENWKNTGLSSQEIERRLFDSLYPPVSESASGKQARDEDPAKKPADATPSPDNQPEKSPTRNQPAKKISPDGSNATDSRAPTTTGTAPYFAGVLFSAASVQDCVKYRGARTERLSQYLNQVDDPKVKNAASSCAGNDACLRTLVEKICPR